MQDLINKTTEEKYELFINEIFGGDEFIRKKVESDHGFLAIYLNQKSISTFNDNLMTRIVFCAFCGLKA